MRAILILLVIAIACFWIGFRIQSQDKLAATILYVMATLAAGGFLGGFFGWFGV